MPPGSGKSVYTSILLPPWFLANNPDKSIIAASHTIELAEKWGRRGRNLVSDNSLTLGIAIASHSQAAGRWALTSGGEYLSAGVGTAIAGFRADLALVDDPVRNREDADLEHARERTYEWYRSHLLPRLKPGGRVIIIQTRWHEDDLAGRLLAEMESGGEHWEVVVSPAEGEPNDPLGREVGEMLWGDDDYGYANSLRQQKAEQPAYNWSALFQQQPAPETGSYFLDEWLRPYRVAPDRRTLHVYAASDFAVTAAGGDFTVHLIVGVDPADNLWVLDMYRRQADTAQSVDALLDLVRDWRPWVVAQEHGQIESAIGPFLRKRMNERKIWVATKTFPTRGDKSVRAQSIRGRMAVRGLYVPAGAPWLHDFRSELLAFPVGKHDDICDALGLVGQIIDRMSKGRRCRKRRHRRSSPPIPAPAPSPSRTCSKQTSAGARSLVGEFRGNGTNDQPTTFGFWICIGAKLTRRRASIGAARAIIYGLDTAPGQPRPIIMVRIERARSSINSPAIESRRHAAPPLPATVDDRGENDGLLHRPRQERAWLFLF